MVRLYLGMLTALFGWNAQAEDTHAQQQHQQIEALIGLEDEVKDEYDRLLRYKRALDCLDGNSKSSLNLTCFDNGQLGIRVFGTCAAGVQACEIQVNLGSPNTDSVAIVKSDEDAPIALNQCGKFRRGGRCACPVTINLTLTEKKSIASLTKVELHIKNSDGAWQKIFADKASNIITNKAILANDVFKSAESGVCN